MHVYLLIGDIGEGIKVHGVYGTPSGALHGVCRTLEGVRRAALKSKIKPTKWISDGPDRWTSGVDWLAIEAKNLEE